MLTGQGNSQCLTYKICIFLLFILCLASCAKAPKCTYKGDSSLESNAGCLTVLNEKLLIIEGTKSLFQLPGGGTSTGEVAQCTAERETWEETGIRVKATDLVETFDNGFSLFVCEVVGDQVVDGSNRPWRFEVKDVHWLGVDDFANKKWRFPEQVALIKQHLKRKNRAD